MTHVVALDAKRWNRESQRLLELDQCLRTCIVVARPAQTISAKFFGRIAFGHLDQALLEPSSGLREPNSGRATILQPGGERVRVLRERPGGHHGRDGGCGIAVEVPQDDPRQTGIVVILHEVRHRRTAPDDTSVTHVEHHGGDLEVVRRHPHDIEVVGVGQDKLLGFCSFTHGIDAITEPGSTLVLLRPRRLLHR